MAVGVGVAVSVGVAVAVAVLVGVGVGVAVGVLVGVGVSVPVAVGVGVGARMVVSKVALLSVRSASLFAPMATLFTQLPDIEAVAASVITAAPCGLRSPKLQINCWSNRPQR